MRYKREDKAHVWCDHHGEIHERKQDVYDESPLDHRLTDCEPMNWRKVYVETDDPDEVFE